MAELLQNAASGGVRERGEGGIEAGLSILNHMVQYVTHGLAGCKGRGGPRRSFKQANAASLFLGHLKGLTLCKDISNGCLGQFDELNFHAGKLTLQTDVSDGLRTYQQPAVPQTSSPPPAS